MSDQEVDELRERLEVYVGKPIAPPSLAPDPVNVPMIRHWVDALDDQNPIYLDEEFAATTSYVFNHPQVAAQMGQQGRRYVLENFTWEAVIGRYRQLVDEMGGL